MVGFTVLRRRLARPAAAVTAIDAAIAEAIASGDTLAAHDGLWPTHAELRRWYWGQAYESCANAIESWSALLQAFGANEIDAQHQAEAFAGRHGYQERRRSTSHKTYRGPSVIDAVKAAVPIEAVARELTELRQGRNALTGRCPFHDDQSPSFVVWPAHGLWRCYGACAEGGDVVKLWQRAREKGRVR